MRERDSGKALLGALLLILTFAIFAYGWFFYQDYRVLQLQRSKALRSAEIELAAESLDRETVGMALRLLAKALDSDPSLDDGVPPADELIRQRTRLQLALGQTTAAWEGIEAYVISPDSRAEDLWLGAEASTARYARRGTEAEGLRAFGLVARHYQQTGELRSQFLAAMLAYRLTEVAEFCELRDDLLAEHGNTREGRFLAGLGYSLGVHLSERIGFSDDAETLAKLAASAGERQHTLLARLRLAAADTSIAGDLAALEALEGEFVNVPIELQVAIAEAMVGRPGASATDLQAGLRHLQQGLVDFPSCLEARHVAAVIHYALSSDAWRNGQSDRAESETSLCQGQLRWLLKNAQQDDSRRGNWRAMQR